MNVALTAQRAIERSSVLVYRVAWHPLLRQVVEESGHSHASMYGAAGARQSAGDAVVGTVDSTVRVPGSSATWRCLHPAVSTTYQSGPAAGSLSLTRYNFFPGMRSWRYEPTKMLPQVRK